MKLREVTIRNFRSLANITIPMDDLTVLVGPNNAGKTALLDALKIAFRARGWELQEYDYHISAATDTPKTCNGIEITLWFRENAPNEWPEELLQELNECMQTDPSGRNSVGLRFSSCFNEAADAMDNGWEFLTVDGQPLVGKAGSQTFLNKFLEYVRIFPLPAMRDIAVEFSPKSQFWGRILRDLKIDDNDLETVKTKLAKLNKQLLGADNRLEQVRRSIDGIQDVIRIGKGERVDIEALPMKPWDLMTKSQVVIRDMGSNVPLPLHRYGQGTQSLAILFLFQAYVDLLFRATSHEESEAILALEEPEAHLHPQAARALAANLGKLTSQKIISSHSPYFIQEIPLQHIRMFRKSGCVSNVLYVKRQFEATLPDSEALKQVYQHNPKFSYDITRRMLVVQGMINDNERAQLINCCPNNLAEIERLYAESATYLTDEELVKAQTSVKRMRGEILFAHGWFLCEGQSEYLLVQLFASLLGKPFDRECISVIDYQNNGPAGLFAKLASIFNIPWVLIGDDDDQFRKVTAELEKHRIPQSLIDRNARRLTQKDLEMYLLRNGFLADYTEIVDSWGVKLKRQPTQRGFTSEIYAALKARKTEHATALAERLSQAPDRNRVPALFRKAINDLIGMVNKNAG